MDKRISRRDPKSPGIRNRIVVLSTRIVILSTKNDGRDPRIPRLDTRIPRRGTRIPRLDTRIRRNLMPRAQQLMPLAQPQRHKGTAPRCPPCLRVKHTNLSPFVVEKKMICGFDRFSNFLKRKGWENSSLLYSITVHALKKTSRPYLAISRPLASLSLS